MSAVTLTLQAERVERSEVHAGERRDGDAATQTLRFFDELGACVLVMTLVWPLGTLSCPAVLLKQGRESGPRD